MGRQWSLNRESPGFSRGECQPGISVWMENGSQDCGAELLCLAEYNPDHPAGQELCIGAYQDKDDEPVFYESYHKGENE
jgi:hypothetical protein